MSLRGWLAGERDSYLLGLLRVAVSVLLLLNTLRLLRSCLRAGYFGDFFHMPLLPEACVPSRELYLGLLGLQCGAALLSLLGLAARPALLSASLLGLYALACDRLQYHNNRYLLHLVGLLVAVGPCDRSFLLLRGRRHALPEPERRAPLWARQLIGLQLSLVYLASGGSKLLDPAWRDGTVMLHRFAEGALWLEPRGLLPGWGAQLLGSPLLAELASKAAIGTELGLALGVWSVRARAATLWLGVIFHLGIELSAKVELFSYLMLSAYLVFAAPELQQRAIRWTPGAAGSARLVPLLAGLDWLARFRLWPRSPGSPGPISVLDHAGTEHFGWSALTQLARALPLLFPLWLPLALASRLAQSFRRATATS